MAFGEDSGDKAARLAGGAAVLAGVGYAGYRGYQDYGGTIDRLVKTSKAAVSTGRTITSMAHTPIEFQETLLQEAFNVADDVMTPAGWNEMLGRTYQRALYKAGVVDDVTRTRIVQDLVKSGRSWKNARGTLLKYGHQTGGFEGIYRALREMVGGTVKGRRSKDVSELIRELSTGVAGQELGAAKGVRPPYDRSAFQKGGAFWSEAFGSGAEQVDVSSMLGMVTKRGFQRETALQRILGGGVRAGVRAAERPRSFQTQRGAFRFNLPGIQGGTELPFVEFQVGGKGSKTFLSVPTVPEAMVKRGMNFVAADHRGMGFASVPHFAIPVNNGTRYDIVDFNKGIDIMLFGSKEYGVTEGLAQKLHKLQGDRKAVMDLTNEWNTMMGSLFHRVQGGQGDMKQAMLHGSSVVPVERLMAEMGIIKGQKASMEGLTEFFGKLVGDKRHLAKGYDFGPLAGADPMTKSYRVSLYDYAKRWDIFGGDFPMERRYLSRFRPFSLTSEAAKAAAASPIGGILRRGVPITATEAARGAAGVAGEMHQMPSAVGYLSLSDAKTYGEEEIVMARRMSKMMETKTTTSLEVAAGEGFGRTGQVLGEGDFIGVDYRTGESIFAKGERGRVEQKIMSAKQHGDIVKLEVETVLPLQDQSKIYSMKAQVHRARGGMAQELIHEHAVLPGSAAGRYVDDIEVAGAAALLKENPAEVHKQMAEASWLTARRAVGDKSLAELGKETSSSMHRFVYDEKSRMKSLGNRRDAGIELGKSLVRSKIFQKGQEHFGTGLEMLRQAKNWGLDAGDLGLVGGLFYKTLVSGVGPAQARKLLKDVGMAGEDLTALAGAKGVLAMPTMHFGGYASFDHRYGRAGMDYRALMEVKAQNWGEAGDLLVEEIARRTIPKQNFAEMRRAAFSVVGKDFDVPEGIEKISSLREAQETLGERGFLLDYDDQELYVPGPSAKGMGQTITEIGEVEDESLRKAYSGYIRAQRQIRDGGAEVQLTKAKQHLMEQVHKEWASAQTLSGKVIGTAGPVARTWVPGAAKDTLARHFENIDDFIASGKQTFTVGVTRETGERMFRDLFHHATKEEKSFLLEQQKAFRKGQKVTGFVWRHPTHRPQSLLPAFFQLAEGEGEGALFSKTTLQHGGRTLDVSGAAGMKLDYDFDHVQLGIIADEKVKAAQDTLLNSSRYKKQFVEGVAIQADIMRAVKSAADTTPAAKSYITGLQRLVGVKMETGVISNLVGEMRAAAAFNATGREFTVASYLLAELEEGPISSKHGLHVGKVKNLLGEFVRNEGVKVSDAMKEAWDLLLDKGVIEADSIKYSRDEFVQKMSGWLEASEKSGELGAFRRVVRQASQASRGKVWEGITQNQFMRAIRSSEGGVGDLTSALMREMRLGPGSAIPKAKAVMEAGKRVGSVALKAFKKHWKYPAMGIAAAAGIGAIASGGSLSMPQRDHAQAATSLAAGGSPSIQPPNAITNRIVTSGGGSMPGGYMMHGSGDYSSAGMRGLANFNSEMGGYATLRDNRGAITPEYIRKAQTERYD